MHTCLIPIGTCEKMDKIIRGFVWDDNEGRKQLHFQIKQTICGRRKYVGVGLRPLHDVNLTLMEKTCMEVSS